MAETALSFDQHGYLLPYETVRSGTMMEINNDLEIQIFHTLEQVKLTNEAIRRHRQADEPNVFMIEQFQEMKLRLTDELSSLLSTITEMQWQIAA